MTAAESTANALVSTTATESAAAHSAAAESAAAHSAATHSRCSSTTLTHHRNTREGRWHSNCQRFVSFVFNNQIRIGCVFVANDHFDLAMIHGLK
ncbi:MAG: hypothetical protein GY880_05200 [Planctomycetaceae bacterium]|nr:hypothetical protein [Planctomycetaceae bacterium]